MLLCKSIHIASSISKFVAGAVLLLSVCAAASDLDPQVLMKERKQNYSGWDSSEVALTMTLHTASGQLSVRKLRTQALEVENDGDKALTIFDEPMDVSGVALLTHSHITGADDQWLFLPSLKRTKRISSSNKSGAFMGSEFAFEDMSSFEYEKYKGISAREEMMDGKSVYLVEMEPDYKDSGYTRMLTWLDKNHKQPLKVEFYDRKNTLLKTLILSDYRQYPNKAWRAHVLKMKNIQTNKDTELLFSNFNFTVSLNDDDFNKNVLNRIR
jgi:outer membrane lipoprotein-sorting protein